MLKIGHNLYITKEGMVLVLNRLGVDTKNKSYEEIKQLYLSKVKGE